MTEHRAITLLGVRIDSLPLEETLATMQRAVANQQRAILAYINVYAMNTAVEQPRFRRFLNEETTLNFCDGQGVRLGAMLAGEQIDYRYTPPDWIDDLCALCVEHDYSMYFLGAKQGVTAKAAAILQARHPGLRIVGTHHGYFDKAPGSAGTQEIVEHINAANPDLLLLGFGMPSQEYWLAENWGALHATVAMPVGAMFDYVTGNVYRAPRWITDNGLEWLSRLFVEPRRLWRRYLVGNPLFIWRVLTTPRQKKAITPQPVNSGDGIR